MKKLIFSLLLTAFLINISTAQRGVERTGFDGDNFSLEGALEIFKQSNTIRDFERNLNTRDRYVNNLDLNFDGRIDYIRVEHKRSGNFHAIILQVPINRREVQDVAVIELEKTGRRTAMLQIIGDEYLYGNEVIVEPIARGRDTYRNGVVNVYNWNAVRHILRRQYNPWISPYRFAYYPTWWSPWNQYAYYDYYPRTRNYRNFYHYVTFHRVYRVHNFYRPYRVYCPIFVQRSNNVHVINGTTRRPRATTNRAQGGKNKATVRNNTSTRRNNSTVRNNRTQTSPVRQSTTTKPTRVNKTKSSTRVNSNRTSTPTRAKSSTRAKSNRTSTSTRANSSTRVNRSKRSKSPSRVTTTPRRSNTSSVKRNTTRVSKPRTSTTSQRRTTTSAKRSTSRVTSTKRSNRRN